MPDPDSAQPVADNLASAIGRVPSGLFILTIRSEDRSTGMLASWVQQAGFDPPMVTVAIARDRYVSHWIDQSKRFTLNQVAKGDRRLLKHFAKGFAPESAAFEGLELIEHSANGPVLASALSYLDVEAVDSIDSFGDHQIYLGRLLGGSVLNPISEPMVHVRRNGLHY